MFSNRSFQSTVRILVCILGSSLALGAAAFTIVVEPTTVNNAWTFALNAIGSDDNYTTDSGRAQPPHRTPILVFRGFDFSGIPTGSRIDGIELSVEGSASESSDPMWFAGATNRRHVKPDTMFDYTFAHPTTGSFSVTASELPEDVGGSPTDAWASGAIARPLTLNRLSHPHFAVAMGGVDSVPNTNFKIDNVFLTVHYTDRGDIEECQYRILFEAEWPILAEDLGLTDDNPETPEARIPERWGLAMVRQVLCKPLHPWHTRTLEVFESNLLELQTETVFPQIEDYQHVVAALLLINQSRQNHFKTLFGLEGEYLTVRNQSRAVDPEVFSDEGDLDGDGASNTEEYDNVISSGGSSDDFANAASDPNSKGIPLPVAGWAGLVILTLLLAVAFRRYSRKASAP